MLYAIVDIETTGGHPSASGITEIAVNIHDGEKVIQHFHSLVNPGRPIPVYITALTGIDYEMVEFAPCFADVAKELAELLADKIFIAHNVNFDYAFLKHYLAMAGYELNCKKLCTVRMSRKVLPGHASYSLGKLCKSLEIPLVDRHRAKGDTDATTLLFELLLKSDTGNLITEMLKKTSKEQQLPPNVSKDEVLRLPDAPGVYYFRDKKGKVIYVGKAVNIKKRVISHFSGHASGRQRQEFLRTIYNIDFIACGTELMALILEAAEIKRLWPENNSALKRYEHKYGLFMFEDQNGYLRLALDRYKTNAQSIQSFNNQLDGYNFLSRLAMDFSLCPKLCYLQKKAGPCTGVAEAKCYGACSGLESPEAYNKRVVGALEDLKTVLPNFALVDAGRNETEYSCLLVENGKFYGMGYVNSMDQVPNDLENLKEKLQPYHSNTYILNLILNHAERYPEKIRRSLKGNTDLHAPRLLDHAMSQVPSQEFVNYIVDQV